MSYRYKDLKPKLFTDEGQRLFLAVRKNALKKLKISGAGTMGKLMELPKGIGAADSWDLMACIDRMAELDEIVEVCRPHCTGQDRVFFIEVEEI